MTGLLALTAPGLSTDLLEITPADAEPRTMNARWAFREVQWRKNVLPPTQRRLEQ
jgi:hypothetical protein